MRSQILGQDGAFIAEWKQFGRPSGVALRDDMIYVADSESNGVAPHPGWKRGIRIGGLKDGKVLYRIPDPLEMKGTSAAEGVAVDAEGNGYGGGGGPAGAGEKHPGRRGRPRRPPNARRDHAA